MEEMEEMSAALWADVNGYNITEENIVSTEGVLKKKWGIRPKWKVYMDNISNEHHIIERY